MTRFEDLTNQIEANMGAATPLPAYRCHKEVWALKIKEVVEAPMIEYPSAIIVPEGHFGPIFVDSEFVTKHRPKIGGYIVFYKDGYRSFSPAEAFEDGYTRM
jgi:hypothetical protein